MRTAVAAPAAPRNRIVIAGSRALRASAAGPVFDWLLGLEEPTLVMRRARTGLSGSFELALARMARAVKMPVEWHIPARGGRHEVFYRDFDMLAKADLAICVFTAATPMLGGTAHVIEKAIDQRVPAYAYTFNGDRLTRIGEYDPDDAWGKYVPHG